MLEILLLIVSLPVFGWRARCGRLWDTRAPEESGSRALVALGSPEDYLAPAGAARLYAKDSDWTQHVDLLARNARSIVVEVGASANLRWEFEQGVLFRVLGQMEDPPPLREPDTSVSADHLEERGRRPRKGAREAGLIVD
jgi:hypothetical protein